MDSCIAEEQEVFFESLDAIPLSPSTEGESGKEDDNHFHKSPPAMSKVSVENQRVSTSRYEVWQSDSGSIYERRQRLFAQMGLQLNGEDPDKATVLLNTFSSEKRSSMLLPTSAQNHDKVDTGPRSIVASHAVEPFSPVDCMKDHLAGTAHLRDKEGALILADNTHVGDKGEHSFIRSVRSGTVYPAQSGRGNESRSDGSCAVLRSSSSGHAMRAFGSGYKSSIDRDFNMARGSSVREGAVSNQFNGSNHNPLLDFVGLDGKCIDCVPQTVTQDGRLSFKGSVAVQDWQDAELLCRIKDLDSGREFVVNEVGKDGSLNKLKELDTGRELTFEEFESSLGLSPIVQEVMKREIASNHSGAIDIQLNIGTGIEKKKRAWFKVIKGLVNGSRDKGYHKGGSNGRVASLEKSGRRSSSESNDSREAPPQLAKRVKVHAHKKSIKEFADLYSRQEFQAHEGSIWTMKFSYDGSLLATAGQDKAVRVWAVLDCDGGAEFPSDSSGDSCTIVETRGVDNLLQCQSHSKGNVNETSGRTAALSSPCWTSRPFLLSEKPKCDFNGHTEDVLDLAWSRSQFLLSSSMDKTVRLWNVMTGECSRIFAHNDYVTCIHFNPVDDGFFISGSLDGKVRIWSIKERQVVDWVDLFEMVTAACYTQNGQGAVIGSYKGTCYFYKTSDSKLQFDTKFEVQRKKKRRSQGKKITGFQFIPGDEEKLLITSSDSRIRVYDKSKISSKYKGLRNSNSQISATFSSKGSYVICASEDSRVCIWKYYDSSTYPVQKQKTLSGSYEDFFAQHVSIAVPWPGLGLKSLQEKSNDDALIVSENAVNSLETNSDGCSPISILDDNSELDTSSRPKMSPYHAMHGDSVHEDSKECVPSGLSRAVSHHSEHKQNPSCLASREGSSYILGGESLSGNSPILHSYLEDCCSAFSKEQAGSYLSFSEGGGSATWPEEKLPSVQQTNYPKGEKKAVNAPGDVVDKKVSAITKAWGLVIVTAGLGGEIQIFQNQTLPN
eukprot:c23276_g2_i1 orf=160-3174(-)